MAVSALPFLDTQEKAGTAFVTFTTDLITNVMEALVASQTEQLKAYGDMVKSVAGTTAEYQQNVAGLQADNNGDYLVSENQDIIGGFSADILGILLDFTSPPTGNVVSGNEAVVTQALAGATRTVDGNEVTIEEAVAKTAADTPVDVTQDALAEYILDHLTKAAAQEYDLLKFMIKAGMQKIDITNGHILTKLFIEFDTTEFSSTDTASVDASERAWGWKAGVSGRFNWWKTGKSRSFMGFSASGGMTGKRVKVKTVRTSDLSSTNLSAEMLGEVKINFASNSFPAAELE